MENKNPKKLEGLFTDLLGGLERHIEASILTAAETAPLGGPKYDIAHRRILRFNAEVRLGQTHQPTYIFNRGLGLSLLDASMALCSNPAFCPGILLPDSEVIHVSGSDLGLEDASPQIRFVDYRPQGVKHHEQIAFGVPRYTENEQRQHLGDILFELALRYVSLHEQAHIYQGHLLFAGNRGHALSWREIDDPDQEEGNPTERNVILQASPTEPEPPSPIPAKDIQALELQADTFAMYILLEAFIEKGPNEHYQNSSILNTGADWLFYCFLAQTVVFTILDRADHHLTSSVENRQHPEARVRFLGSLATLQSLLLKHIPSEEERITFVTQVLTASRHIFDLVEATPFDTDTFNEYFSENLDNKPDHIYESGTANTLNELITRLRSFHKELTELSRIAKANYRL